MPKRLFAFLTVFALAAALFRCGYCENAVDRREVIYFYENYCESCSPEEDFIEYFQSLTGIFLADCDYRAYNVARSSGQTALAEAESLYNLTDISIPMTIVDGTAYCGDSEMQSRLAQDALSWGVSTDSLVVLLTVPMCESCVRAANVLETLPETVLLHRGDLEIESAVICEIIDISAQPETAAQFFEAYSVPDEQRITPCAFFSNHYLAGADAIEKNLAAMVDLGWAAGGVRLPSANEEHNH